MKLRWIAALAVLVVPLAGCDPDRGEVGAATLEGIEEGAPAEEVFAALGPGPHGEGAGFRVREGYRAHRYLADGREAVVVYYEPGPDAVEEPGPETHTPVVLVDGVLEGWGWRFLEEFSARHGLAPPGITPVP